jgi:hypothetical protein
MKMWIVERGARGTLYTFGASGDLIAQRSNFVTTRRAEFDDGEVVDYVHVHNSRLANRNVMEQFPSTLHQMDLGRVLREVEETSGSAIVQMAGGKVYILVLTPGEINCLA